MMEDSIFSTRVDKLTKVRFSLILDMYIFSDFPAMTSIGNFVPVELFIVDRHFGFCRSPDFSGSDLASHFAGQRTGNGLSRRKKYLNKT
jgi:hypothetical protein